MFLFNFPRYPESFTFKDCSELYEYEEYMEKIKEPIALDLIKERLHPDCDEQVNNNPILFSSNALTITGWARSTF